MITDALPAQRVQPGRGTMAGRRTMAAATAAERALHPPRARKA